MSGVMYFNDKRVVRFVENPGGDPNPDHGGGSARKVLVHLPTNETITSYAMLDQKLSPLGWERYSGNPDLLQFHKATSRDLISLPFDFSKFRSVHMYDIIFKNRDVFEVRDA